MDTIIEAADMIMLRDNLERALTLAIAEAQRRDQSRGIDESVFTVGLQEIMGALLRGEQIEISFKTP